MKPIQLGPKGTKIFIKLYPLFALIMLLIFLGLLLGTGGILYYAIKGGSPSTFCYAIFLADGVAANLTFALGRSNIFLEKYKEKTGEKLIYNAGACLAIGAFLSLLSAGFAYLELNLNQSLTHEYYKTIVLVILGFFLLIAIILTLTGLFYFFNWTWIAFKDKGKEWAEAYENDPLRNIL